MEERKNASSIWLSPLVQREGISVEFRGDHVYIQLGRGIEVSPQQRTELWDRIGRICEEHKCRSVLVEGFAPAGVFEASEVVDAGIKTATVPRLWMAMCFNNFQPNELSELFEAVAGSRGVRVKHFTRTESALQWLRKNAHE